MNKVSDIKFVEKMTMMDSLIASDPYDIWKTDLGVKTKILYYKNKYLGILPAALLTFYDYYFNNKYRLGYKKQEYPIVRAQAIIGLLNLYKNNKNEKYIVYARKHIDWLLANTSKNYSGYCWGAGFKIVISDTLIYNEETPFTTNTPYVLEAFHNYYKITNDSKILPVIKSIYKFYENDILVLKEDDDILITSYGPFKDRIVTNAVSYTMYAYSIFYNYIDDKVYVKNKIKKMYQFIKNVQKSDGSWFYAPYDKNSFIDCFHSCFVLKNIYKANREFKLNEADLIIDKGYKFIKDSFYSKKNGLFRRFARKNKPSLVKFDLYDNSEVLYLAKLLNDRDVICDLNSKIETTFIDKNDMYSVIDIFGFKKNKNCLRWAVMPYILTKNES